MTPAIPRLERNITPASILMGAALLAGTSAIASTLFTSIGAIGGAIFGASFALTGSLVRWVFEKIDPNQDSTTAKTAQFVITLLGGIAMAGAITYFAGFPLTLGSGMLLALGSLVVGVGGALAMGGCLCSSAIATAIAIGGGDNQEPRFRV